MSGRLFDFRRSYWGHALHGASWDEVERTERYGFWGIRRRKVIDRTVLVHCKPDPEPGDFVLYEAVGHVLRRAPVIRVDGFLCPRDMFKLFLGDTEVVGPAVNMDAIITKGGDVVITGMDEMLGRRVVSDPRMSHNQPTMEPTCGQ